MKRLSSYLACVAGLVVLACLLPLFSASQPRVVRLTRAQALKIGDAEARRIGIPVEKAWSTITWVGSPLLDQELDSDPTRRRAAGSDPVIGPRMGGYRVAYYRKELEKTVPYGDIYITGDTGEVMGERRRMRNEEAGAQVTEQQLRERADALIRSRKFAGSPSVKFESARPTVQRNRTDWVFRYKVASTFPTGNVVPYLYVYFTGDRLAGFGPVEEYADGSQFRGDNGSDIAGTFAQIAAIFAMLLLLLLIFLKKYHAGEVGVRTASFVFGVTIVFSALFSILCAPAAAESAQFGSMAARETALAVAGFQFLFYFVPLAVVVFLAWAVGESYARERWGERLASFDAILRRDPLNATVGRAVLNGLLTAPAVAAAALAVAWIPVALKFAHPALGGASRMILSSGSITQLVSVFVTSIIYAIVAVLFILSFSNSRRVLAIGIAASIATAMIGNVFELPMGPYVQQILFGFGGMAAVVAVFLAYDLLAATTALFVGEVLLSFLPLAHSARGAFAQEVALVVLTPLTAAIIFAIVARLTDREVVYKYEDLAPHVKRIVERERVKAEIDAANRIQAALLPLDPPSLIGASVASHYRAATEIGGDYFDFLPQPTGEIGIAFGDVSGHGLTSGIVMAMAKAALLVQVDYDASPRAVMSVLNEIVIKTAPKRILMTFFFGLLDPRAQSLRFSSAGHLDPYVYRAATKRIEALSSWGFPLGVRRREAFREHSVDFTAGDRLVLYSDGLIEAVDDDGEPYGFERFEQTIRGCGHQSAEEIKKTLLASVKKFTRNRPPEDDQTLVVVGFEEVAAGQVVPGPVEYSGDVETVN